MLRCVRKCPRTRPSHSRPLQSCRLLWTTESEPDWFRALRAEMLARRLPMQHEIINSFQEERLRRALRSHVPPEWFPETTFSNEDKFSNLFYRRQMPLGHHLIYANHDLPENRLLPDGTDPLHSPGGAFVRRMWAGGSLNVDDSYYSRSGLNISSCMTCVERISHVQLRGERDSAKVFVTIDRHIAAPRSPKENRRYLNWEVAYDAFSSIREARMDYLNRVIRNPDESGALLVEQRRLVFMKQRIGQDLPAPTKYLPSPGELDFSHTLIPTSTLLFRYSALSCNAHAIHLNPEYARNVEGYRNVLVHGPLQLLLILKLVASNMNIPKNIESASTSQPEQIIRSIEYRNVAPLYCNEEMRLCGRRRPSGSSDSDGAVYDVWIEGPTGGAAFTGKVHTAPLPSKQSCHPAVSHKREMRKEADTAVSSPDKNIENPSSPVQNDISRHSTDATNPNLTLNAILGNASPRPSLTSQPADSIRNPFRPFSQFASRARNTKRFPEQTSQDENSKVVIRKPVYELDRKKISLFQNGKGPGEFQNPSGIIRPLIRMHGSWKGPSSTTAASSFYLGDTERPKLISKLEKEDPAQPNAARRHPTQGTSRDSVEKSKKRTIIRFRLTFRRPKIPTSLSSEATSKGSPSLRILKHATFDNGHVPKVRDFTPTDGDQIRPGGVTKVRSVPQKDIASASSEAPDNARTPLRILKHATNDNGPRIHKVPILTPNDSVRTSLGSRTKVRPVSQTNIIPASSEATKGTEASGATPNAKTASPITQQRSYRRFQPGVRNISEGLSESPAPLRSSSTLSSREQRKTRRSRMPIVRQQLLLRRVQQSISRGPVQRILRIRKHTQAEPERPRRRLSEEQKAWVERLPEREAMSRAQKRKLRAIERGYTQGMVKNIDSQTTSKSFQDSPNTFHAQFGTADVISPVRIRRLIQGQHEPKNPEIKTTLHSPEQADFIAKARLARRRRLTNTENATIRYAHTPWAPPRIRKLNIFKWESPARTVGSRGSRLVYRHSRLERDREPYYRWVEYLPLRALGGGLERTRKTRRLGVAGRERRPVAFQF